MQRSPSLVVSVVLTIWCAVGASGAAAAAAALEGLRPPPTKPATTLLDAGDLDDRVVLKLAHDSGLHLLRDGTFAAPPRTDPNPLVAVIERFAAVARPLFDVSAASIQAARRTGEARTGRALPDLNLYFELALATVDAAALCDALNELAAVEIAYPMARPIPPPGDLPPVTDDCRINQGYAGPAPAGLDPTYAWNFPGGRGQGMFVADIEYDWHDDHEDLERAFEQRLIYETRGLYGDHGTAVLGVLIASDDRWGVTGLVPEAAVGLVTHYPVEESYNVARAITAAAELMSPGDVLLIEAQVDGPTGDYVPVEWLPAEYDAIAIASANGIVVVEAGGNGGVDLDGPEFLGRFDRAVRDSGAIIVGAGYSTVGAEPDRSRKSFSCYGSRVDLQAWGEEVMTTGYYASCSGLLSDPQQQYRTSFNGTSSASPMVAAAVLSLQGIQRARGLPPLEPIAIRELLIATGSPQQLGLYNGNIGPRPDLRAALRALFGEVMYDGHVVHDVEPEGNGDAVIDPGEVVGLELCVLNAHATRASGVTVRAVSRDPWLKVLGAEWEVGDLDPGARACSFAPYLALLVAPSAPCGAAAFLGLEVQSDLGTDSSGTVRLTVGRDAACTARSCPNPAPTASPTLFAVRSGVAELALSWTSVAGAVGYRVWGASRVAAVASTLVAETWAPGPTGATVGLGDEGVATFSVRALNDCGWEGP